jgi:hypothetical protein
MTPTYHFFCTFNKSQIYRGLMAAIDRKVYEQLLAINAEEIAFAYDTELQDIAFLWIENDEDFILTGLAL